MEQLIVVFLLFVAVLAFAWFYLQRAKARDAVAASSTHEPSVEQSTASSTLTDEPPA